ncbi:S-linalool synthase [Bienertia sinuspersici]
MASSLDMIKAQVEKIKESLLIRVIENPSSFVSPSAYDTAWLAMVGDPKKDNEKPMFRGCLEWILSNQMTEGFWGERDCNGNPTIDSLPATLACMVALKMWDLGHQHIEKDNNDEDCYPRWFAIVFPGMVEVAQQRGLQDNFANNQQKSAVTRAFFQQQNILRRENLVDKYQHFPLLSYLEALPSSYQIDEATILSNLSDDGSLFQSPAATVAAYIATRNPETLSYLHNLLLEDEHALQLIEDNHEMFTSMLYNLYRATNLMFESEEEMGELRSFSRRLLEKSSLSRRSKTITMDDGIFMWPHLQETIKRELFVPWLARMDHLDHREISCLDNMDLLQLAKENYEYRQMVYKKELVELLRWSNEWGIPDMGFARDKAIYCYFAISSSSSLPYDTDIRLIVAKSAVLITIFDDFFDMEGSLDELQILANAWYEVVASWLTEATWSKTGKIPSMASYMETGMVSVAAHTMVLQASPFSTSSFSPHHNLYPSQYQPITKLLMTACRLLNDIQSYEKEVKDGKINSVLLHLKENPNTSMEDAVEYIYNILEGIKMRLLEHALMDEIDDDMPRSCKMLHLHALKVFQMFYNSGNHFDSKDSLLNDIEKAIFVPFEEDHISLESNPPTQHLKLPYLQKKKALTVNSHHCALSLKNYGRRKKMTTNRIPLAMPLRSHQVRMKIAPSCCFNFAW